MSSIPGMLNKCIEKEPYFYQNCYNFLVLYPMYKVKKSVYFFGWVLCGGSRGDSKSALEPLKALYTGDLKFIS